MFPAQALAEEMLRRGWQVDLSTDARGAEHASAFPVAAKRQVVRSASPTRGGPFARLLVGPVVLWGILSTTLAMVRRRPTCVIGFGGYPAIPAVAAAWILRVPRLIHEQNGVLGRVNGVFARRVNAVACGTWPTTLPPGVTGHTTGNPVRSAVRERAGAPYPSEGLELLVFGGSQGARIMRRVPEALALLPEAKRDRMSISHQARAEDGEDMDAAYREIGARAEIRPFFDDMADRLTRSHLVICRAGASSLADLTVVGRPAILIPLAIAVRDEQTANARPLVDAGAAQMIPEAELTPERLAGCITAVIDAPEAARAAAAASRSLGKPDAAERLADLVIETATAG